MVQHIKKEKGDLAVAKTIADLTEKEYKVFIPVLTEHLPFDIIAYKDNISYRIQVKYSPEGKIKNTTNWNDKNGTHTKRYNHSDFDYYAIYIPNVNQVLYPHINFGGAKITTKLSNSATPFYWWEDFINFTDHCNKKTFKDFGIKINPTITDAVIKSRLKRQKVERPSKDELEKLLWEIPTSKLAKQFGVSDKAVEKWAKTYEISKPPRGYWNRKTM